MRLPAGTETAGPGARCWTALLVAGCVIRSETPSTLTQLTQNIAGTRARKRPFFSTLPPTQTPRVPSLHFGGEESELAACKRARREGLKQKRRGDSHGVQVARVERLYIAAKRSMRRSSSGSLVRRFLA